MSEYERIRSFADFIGDRLGRANIMITLGSGLGSYASHLQGKADLKELSYADIPGFPRSTVTGHAGKFVSVCLNGKRIILMSGRLHLYEGHPISDVVLPVRAMHELGVSTMILTNAAGGVNPSLHSGTLMLITDHINLSGQNPLIGPNIDALGPRFPDMTHAYSPRLLAIARRAAAIEGKALHEGVYCMLTGPSYETPAEIRMIRTIGGDAVGMSTVPEAITANHMGMEVMGISCITNMAAGISGNSLSHSEVIEAGLKTEKSFSAIMDRIIDLL